MNEKEFPPIQQRLMHFIRKQFQPGYNHYNVLKLIGDASARQYFRYVDESNRSFILAAYPEAFDPLQFTYKQVYDLFREIGLPVPEIISMDGPLGIVLQQDLGNESFQRRLLTATPEERKALFRRAVDHIVTIQRQGTAALKPAYEAARLAFDEEKLSWELGFFRRHYLGNYRKLQLQDEERLQEEFSRLAAELATSPRFLCHRDYHVRNLMLAKGELYILDFQDARMGPPTYDLASLVKDSVELSADEINELVDYYLSLAEPAVDLPSFLRQFHLTCIQRLLKALGTYGYQIVVRGNFIYEQYMGGSLHRALLSLRSIPEFPCIQSTVERELEV